MIPYTICSFNPSEDVDDIRGFVNDDIEEVKKEYIRRFYLICKNIDRYLLSRYLSIDEYLPTRLFGNSSLSHREFQDKFHSSCDFLNGHKLDLTFHFFYENKWRYFYYDNKDVYKYIIEFNKWY